MRFSLYNYLKELIFKKYIYIYIRYTLFFVEIFVKNDLILPYNIDCILDVRVKRNISLRNRNVTFYCDHV